MEGQPRITAQGPADRPPGYRRRPHGDDVTHGIILHHQALRRLPSRRHTRTMQSMDSAMYALSGAPRRLADPNRRLYRLAQHAGAGGHVSNAPRLRQTHSSGNCNRHHRHRIRPVRELFLAGRPATPLQRPPFSSRMARWIFNEQHNRRLESHPPTGNAAQMRLSQPIHKTTLRKGA